MTSTALNESTATQETCALHTVCLRTPHAQRGDTICALCSSLEHATLKEKIGELLSRQEISFTGYVLLWQQIQAIAQGKKGIQTQE